MNYRSRRFCTNRHGYTLSGYGLQFQLAKGQRWLHLLGTSEGSPRILVYHHKARAALLVRQLNAAQTCDLMEGLVPLRYAHRNACPVCPVCDKLAACRVREVDEPDGPGSEFYFYMECPKCGLRSREVINSSENCLPLLNEWLPRT